MNSNIKQIKPTTYFIISMCIATKEHLYEEESGFDIFTFLLRYSFLLNDATKPQNSRVQKTSQLNAPQGNIYMGARYLDPKYSRWISVDPALGEYITPDKNKNYGVLDFINLNLYHYGHNNPITYKDPNGRRDFLNWLYDLFEQSYGADGADYIFKNDSSIQFASTVDAALKGDSCAQRNLKYAFHEVSREMLTEISEKSGYAAIVCLSIGQPELSSAFVNISTVCDSLLVIDDFITDLKKSNGDYSTPIKNLAANGSIIVVGLIYSPLQKYETTKFAKSINITVGKTGRFYEVGHRGAIKSEKALRKLLAKDIAAGYFGQEVIPNAPLIIDQAQKVYRRLMENENEK